MPRPPKPPAFAVALWPIDRVTPYDRNPRVNDPAVDAVAASLREFGFRQPIVVDAAGVILAGHTRWKAARQLGLTQVPVHVAADLSAEQLRAYRLADNATADLAVWDLSLLPLELGELQACDYDISQLGFGADQLARLLDDSITIKPLDTQPPPVMAWVLIGIPTIRFGEINQQIEQLAAVEGITLETVVNGG